MIINDEHKFVFVHIPKCAGTTIRNSLESINRSESRFVGPANHPALGKVDMAHIPLSILHEYFPEEYQKLTTYASFAVVRDPFLRFPSSVSQRFRMYGDGPSESMTKKEFAREVDEAISVLVRLRGDALLPYDFIHFQRQHTFVLHGDKRVVRKLFPLDRVPDLFEYVGGLIGAPIEPAPTASGSHQNKSELFKTDLLGKLAKPLLPLYSRLFKGWLPVSFRNSLSDLFLVDRDRRFRDVFESDHVRQFIGDYYAEDIQLFDEVRSQDAGDQLRLK